MVWSGRPAFRSGPTTPASWRRARGPPGLDGRLALLCRSRRGAHRTSGPCEQGRVCRGGRASRSSGSWAVGPSRRGRWEIQGACRSGTCRASPRAAPTLPVPLATESSAGAACAAARIRASESGLVGRDRLGVEPQRCQCDAASFADRCEGATLRRSIGRSSARCSVSWPGRRGRRRPGPAAARSLANRSSAVPGVCMT